MQNHANYLTIPRVDFCLYSAQMLNKDKSPTIAVGQKERPLHVKLPRNEKPSAQPRAGTFFYPEPTLIHYTYTIINFYVGSLCTDIVSCGGMDLEFCFV